PILPAITCDRFSWTRSSISPRTWPTSSARWALRRWCWARTTHSIWARSTRSKCSRRSRACPRATAIASKVAMRCGFWACPVTEQSDRPLRLDVTAEGAMFASHEQYRLLEVARVADQLRVDFIDVTDHVRMRRNALQG